MHGGLRTALHDLMIQCKIRWFIFTSGAHGSKHYLHCGWDSFVLESWGGSGISGAWFFISVMDAMIPRYGGDVVECFVEDGGRKDVLFECVI